VTGMEGPPLSRIPSPASVDLENRDLGSLRLGGWSGLLGLAALGAFPTYRALIRVAPGTATFGVYIGVLIGGYVVAVVFATIGIIVGTAAGRRHSQSGEPAGWGVPAVGILLAFVAPEILVFGVGLASRGEEWALFVSLLPGGLVIGAHVSLLEAAHAFQGWTARPVWLVLPAIAGAVGTVVSVLVLYRSIGYPTAEGMGLGLIGMGLAFDTALLMWAERERRRGSAPWPASPMPPG